MSDGEREKNGGSGEQKGRMAPDSGTFNDGLIPSDTTATNLRDLSRTREVLLHRPPRFMAVTIYLLFLLVLAAVAWSVFGYLDVVVRTGGFVRPEQDPVPVHTRQGGKVKDVHVNTGDRVTEGDVLLTFVNRELQNKRARKKASLRSERQQVEKFRALQEQLRSERDFYRTWTKSHEKTLKNMLEDAKRRLDRYEKLLEKDTISKLEHEKALQDVREKELELQRLHKERKKRQAEINRRLEKLSMDITSARGRIEVLETEIDEITAKLKETELLAPRDGVVIHGDPRPGQVVSAGAHLFEIASTEDLRVDLFVSDHDRNRIEKGQATRIRVNAFPHYEYGTLTGEVYYISPDLQSPDPKFMRSRDRAGERNTTRGTGTGNLSPGYRLKVRITGGEFRDELKPGMAVQAELKIEKRRIITVLFRRVRGAISFWNEPES